MKPEMGGPIMSNRLASALLPEDATFPDDGAWQVPVPLESTYQATWNTSPEDFRGPSRPVDPEQDAE